ncbi:hypothetical protein [Janibacter cremeus]|uniref:Uncharacterized protein n=1 Tax=Janibacter cremeus TaxID=1285192 RepID=A0A852VLK9_9MICO|nr:hypothetical protein [Janibacter cremeus]NYF96966.1 hypothetical protein [Janibacter cremeus]
MQDFEVVSQGEGEYEVSVETGEGAVALTLLLGEAEDSSDGLLGPDESTARATIQYLLQHQDAQDLPQYIDIEEVLAAYPDAGEEIGSLRE